MVARAISWEITGNALSLLFTEVLIDLGVVSKITFCKTGAVITSVLMRHVSNTILSLLSTIVSCPLKYYVVTDIKMVLYRIILTTRVRFKSLNERWYKKT